MKGILLAGGTGSRLRPLTLAVCKQLLPVYDKPLVYYPLSTLMLAGVRDVLVITTPEDQPAFQRLLGDGARLGVALSWATQARPAGIAEALLIGRAFLDGGPCALGLGDNILFGDGLSKVLQGAAGLASGAVVFAHQVREPSRYGVVEFEGERPVAIVEKPPASRSTWAVPGLYFYDGDAPAIAASLAPSARGELEITDVNRAYLERGELTVRRLSRGYTWLDAGTPDSLLEATELVRAVQTRTGQGVGSPEEVAWRMGWIDDAALLAASERHEGTRYGAQLRGLVP